MSQQQERSAQPSAASQTTTDTVRPVTAESSPRVILRLRGGHTSNGRSVSWAEDVVDNEGLGRKSSKVCCIYHRPKGVDESSDESSSDSSSSDSDDSEAESRRKKKANSDKDDCGHSHGPGHRHHHGRGKRTNSKKRAPSPNAYEKIPKPKPKDTGKEIPK
ncbi:phosphatase inhibitor domain-containing protein [Trichoderma chlorosporum]